MIDCENEAPVFYRNVENQIKTLHQIANLPRCIYRSEFFLQVVFERRLTDRKDALYIWLKQKYWEVRL